MTRFVAAALAVLTAISVSGCGSDEGSGQHSNAGAANAGAGTSTGGTSSTAGSGGSTSSTSGGRASGGTSSSSGGMSSSGGSGTPSGGGAQTGDSCETAEDCGDVTANVCDPDDKTCKPAECTATCPESNQVCLGQVDNPSVGACYTTCEPFGDPCSGDRECVSQTLDNLVGLCLSRGSGEMGESCDPLSAITTGCGEGLVCAGDSSTCQIQCDVLQADPGCTPDRRCTIYGFCSADMGDPAAIGEPCAADAASGEFCGNDGKAERGVCAGDAAPLTCYELCSTSSNGCGGGSHQCVFIQRQAPGLGVCVDQAECGDGGSDYTDCDTCLTAEDQGCCGPYESACSNDAACTALNDCVQNCADTDTDCVNNCIADNQDGIVPLLSAITCLYGSTDQEFPGACGTVCPQ